MPPIRRSTRARRPNAKYDSDTVSWDAAALKLLREPSESLGSSASEGERDGGGKAAVTVDVEGEGEGEVDDDDDDDDDNDSSVYDSHDNRQAGRTHDARSPGGGGSAQKTDRSRYGSGTGKYRLTGLYAERLQHWDVGHSRGLKPFGRTAKAMLVTYENVFGPAVDDLRPVLSARDHWGAARDITLPSRITLADRQSSAVAAIAGSHQHATTKVVAQLGALLNFSEGRERTTYCPKPLGDSLLHPLLVGGKVREKDEVQIPAQESIGPSNADAGAAAARQHRYAAYHDASLSGWIVNTGRPINSLAWMPNSDQDQYLAIAYRSQAWERAPALSMPPTAFRPSPLWESTIEILKFASVKPAENEQEQPLRLDTEAVPDLITTTSLKCGDLRHLAWSPGPFIVDGRTVQMLAALSSDGLVRVHVYAFGQPDSSVLEIPTAGLRAEPPENAVFTEVAWVTVTDLAVGASDGSLRLYNVLKIPAFGEDCKDGPSLMQPYLVHELHDTYISSLSPAFPSSTPFYIASRSAVGDMALTDLRNPTQDRVDTANGRRGRGGVALPAKRAMVYAPFTRSWITFGQTTSDNDDLLQTTVECRHLRHFYGEVPVAKLPPSEGQGTVLASSSHHPSILIGSAKGTVFATNYIRTVIPTSVYLPEMDGYLQKVCGYRFEASRSAPTTTTKQDVFYGADIPLASSSASFFSGSSEPVPLDDGTRKRRKNQTREVPDAEPGAGGDGSSISIASMTFGDEQAVTAMAWNPNHDFAGWAAIGWGSGVVRVVDLGHDAS